jgi:hypothetical protein
VALLRRELSPDQKLLLRGGLTWNQDNHWLPNDGTPLAHMGADAAPLLAAFMDTIRFMVERQRSISPSTAEVVVAKVTSHDLRERTRPARGHCPVDGQRPGQLGVSCGHAGVRQPVARRLQTWRRHPSGCSLRSALVIRPEGVPDLPVADAASLRSFIQLPRWPSGLARVVHRPGRPLSARG